MKKVRVDIWSDIACPFCYIGKRRFESALSQFEQRDLVELHWRSFQLDPDLKAAEGQTMLQHLAEKKLWSPAHATEMMGYVSKMAAGSGLTYNLEKSIVANSFDAHRLIQLAKKHQKANDIEELLFAAYFSESRNIADHTVLLDIAQRAGLDNAEVKKMLASDEFTKDVHADMAEARTLGISGVPFFLFNNSYAISGAQETSIFLGALEKILLSSKQII
jgi:predicted DsbA family dithiol-disulfide isomerase